MNNIKCMLFITHNSNTIRILNSVQEENKKAILLT